VVRTEVRSHASRGRHRAGRSACTTTRRAPLRHARHGCAHEHALCTKARKAYPYG
jgi:hypothetical protein